MGQCDLPLATPVSVEAGATFERPREATVGSSWMAPVRATADCDSGGGRQLLTRLLPRLCEVIALGEETNGEVRAQRMTGGSAVWVGGHDWADSPRCPLAGACANGAGDAPGLRDPRSGQSEVHRTALALWVSH
jgi:hypothetical protein